MPGTAGPGPPIPCFSRCGVTAFMAHLRLGPGSSRGLGAASFCLRSAVPVPNPSHSPWSFGEGSFCLGRWGPEIGRCFKRKQAELWDKPCSHREGWYHIAVGQHSRGGIPGRDHPAPPRSRQHRGCHRQSGMWLTLEETVAERCGWIPALGAAWLGTAPRLSHTGAQRMHRFPHAI